MSTRNAARYASLAKARRRDHRDGSRRVLPRLSWTTSARPPLRSATLVPSSSLGRIPQGLTGVGSRASGVPARFPRISRSQNLPHDSIPRGPTRRWFSAEVSRRSRAVPARIGSRAQWIPRAPQGSRRSRAKLIKVPHRTAGPARLRCMRESRPVPGRSRAPGVPRVDFCNLYHASDVWLTACCASLG
jgi:hypothetical protein